MSDASERRHDYPEVAARIARLDEAVARIDRRVEELGPRWHRHDQVLTEISVNLSLLVERDERADQRMDRFQASVEAAFRVMEDKRADDRTNATAEHAALKAEIDSEIAPLKAFIFDRRAVEQDHDQRHRRRQPWGIAIISGMLAAAVSAAGWLLQYLHGAPKP